MNTWSTPETRRRWARTRMTRRAALRGAGVGAAGIAGAALLGCSDEDDGSAPATSAAPAATATAAATTAPAADEPKSGGTLKAYTIWNVDTLDVLSAKSFRTSESTAYVYSRLHSYTVGDNGPAPGTLDGDLAETWETPDPTTITLHLRGGVTWDERAPTNGRALSADDVVASWNKFSSQSLYAGELANVTNERAPIQSVTAIDDSTVQVKLAFPDAITLVVMAWPYDFWVHPVESMNGGFDPANDMRGTGPFILENYSPSVAFKFKKNPKWWGAPRPYLDAVELPILPDVAQSEAQFRARNIYLGGPATQNIPLVAKELDGVEVTVAGLPSGSGTLAYSRTPGSPFLDDRVRKAVSMSFDRDTFVDLVQEPAAFREIGVELESLWNSPLAPAYGAFYLDPKGSDFGPSAAYFQHNIAEAKKMLAAAGFDDSKPLEFDIIFPGVTYGTDNPTRAEIWQSMFADAGMKATLWSTDYTTQWLADIFRTRGQFSGQQGRPGLAWHPNGTRSDPAQVLDIFFSSWGATSEVGDDWPELDQMIIDQRQTLDFDERVQKVHDIQRFMAEQMITIPALPATAGVGIHWKGLRGPGRWRQWPGSNTADGTETHARFWLDDTLRGS